MLREVCQKPCKLIVSSWTNMSNTSMNFDVKFPKGVVYNCLGPTNIIENYLKIHCLNVLEHARRILMLEPARTSSKQCFKHLPHALFQLELKWKTPLGTLISKFRRMFFATLQATQTALKPMKMHCSKVLEHARRNPSIFKIWTRPPPGWASTRDSTYYMPTTVADKLIGWIKNERTLLLLTKANKKDFD